ncbi:MAG: response regulator [Planctomycetota bacterium]
MSEFSTNNRQPVSTLRIKPHEQEKIVKLLNAEQDANERKSRRKSDRQPIPDGVGVTVRITQPGGTSGHYLVRGLNLSQHGIGFIHGGYVHGGSKAVVTLVTEDNERFSINGLIKRCEYVTNGVHFIGVAFDTPFDIDGFLGGVADENGAAAPPKHNVRVTGRVLVLDDSAAARRLNAYLLNRIGASVVEANDIDEACRSLKETPVDLLLCDIWFGELALPSFIDRLRAAAGNDVPILAITGDERKTTHTQATDAGCNEVLVKPVPMAGFNKAMARHLPAPEPVASDNRRRIVSDLWGDTAMRPLIIRFVRDLEALVRQLDTDLTALDTEPGKLAAYNACMRIGADAAAYGFPSIQSIGNTMCMLIDGGAETTELQSQLLDLQARVDAACLGL